MKHKKFYVTGGGGLGDLIRCYLRDKPFWGFLSPLKKAYPEIEFKATICCSNRGVVDFLEYHPLLNKIDFYPWQLSGAEIFERAAGEYLSINGPEARKLTKGLIYEKPAVYLGEEDTRTVMKIQRSGEYIFIHPFAFGADRMPLAVEEFYPLVDRIIDDLGYNVVVAGASYIRENKHGTVEHIEKFEYERDGLFNLVNKSNSRINVRLVQGARAFIGTHSCYILPAWIEEKKTVLIAPPKLQAHLESGDPNSWVTKKKLPFNKTMYIDKKETSKTFFEATRNAMLLFLDEEKA